MTKKPNITEAEWPIMEVLWEKRTASSSEIIDKVTQNHHISARTVKALINRLLTKKAITFSRDEHDARLYHYWAAVSRNDLTKEKNKSLLSMVYGNNPMKLLTRFVRDAKLSPEEIAELHELLDEKDNRKK